MSLADGDKELILKTYKSQKDYMYYRKNQILAEFESPDIKKFIYLTKGRIKGNASLLEKALEKKLGHKKIFNNITDVIGIRVIVLYPQHIAKVDKFIREMVAKNGWSFNEDPKAYQWDMKIIQYFKDQKIDIKPESDKNNRYSGIHYVIRFGAAGCNLPRCEIQIKNPFEELWGEIDHRIRYKAKNCTREQEFALDAIAGLHAPLFENLKTICPSDKLMFSQTEQEP